MQSNGDGPETLKGYCTLFLVQSPAGLLSSLCTSFGTLMLRALWHRIWVKAWRK